MFCPLRQIVSTALNVPAKTSNNMSKNFSPATWCRSVCLFIVIAFTGLAADLYTKHWTFQILGMPGEYQAETEPELRAVYWIWQDVFGIQTALNLGALFGFGSGQTTLLVSFSLIFLAGIVGYLVLCAWRNLLLSAILGMITAGICGNLYDRLGWHGLTNGEGQPIYAVRDWILCMIGTFQWPNFNIADALLVCSVVVLLIQELLCYNRGDRRNTN